MCDDMEVHYKKGTNDELQGSEPLPENKTVGPSELLALFI